MSEQERIAVLVQAIKSLEEAIAVYETNARLLTSLIQREEAVKDTLQYLSERGVLEKGYLPLGESVMLPVDKLKVPQVLVNIGSGYYVESSLERALAIVEERIRTLSESLSNVTRVLEDLKLRYQAIQAELASMVSKQEGSTLARAAESRPK
ncbi:MAG: prefoldin subunit alpha [Thermoproteota archaeon]|nr:MAG: prefoldin subunit alpha [Candidatus Korarchaeota archaeon]RLG55558.1 MAG: prefoldin subunit alpha [Candidatus Korarchaeota archaeon]